MSFSERAFHRWGRRLALTVALACAPAPDGHARTPLALVSAAAGPVTALDRDTAEQLYLGRRSNLSDGTAVQLIDLPAGPERDRFYLGLTGKNPSQIRAYWSRLVFTGRVQPPREAADVAAARRLLGEIPGAIAYLPLEAADSPQLRILLRLE